MGFRNPPQPWSAIERRLSATRRPSEPGEHDRVEASADREPVAEPGREGSDRSPSAPPPTPSAHGTRSDRSDRIRSPQRPPRPSGIDAATEMGVEHPSGFTGRDGGDGPAFSRKRAHYDAPELDRPTATVPYAELHAHSSYSFLDGSSSPEQLVEEAVRLGLSALAITDHDGFYGAARFAEAAEAHGLATVYGAELSLGLSGPQQGTADPEGEHLLLLARGANGYHALAGAITDAQLADGAEKGRPVYDLESLAERVRGSVVALTGCRKGRVRRALGAADAAGRQAAGAALDELVALFGAEHVVVELTAHGDPLDDPRNDALATLAAERGLPTIAAGNAHFARPEGHRLAEALAAVRARRSLDDLDGWLPATAGAHLRSGAEMAARFIRHAGAVERTVALAEQLAFPLKKASPGLPKLDVPEGHTPMSWLRALVAERLPAKYAHLDATTYATVEARVASELDVIEAKDFPGYFLIVEDIVRFARERGILCQGRGSAASSVVCYVLSVTAVDAFFYQLPFERFLSSLRDEEPDIDVDFDSDRREEAIQYVYERYGRRNAAQVANVITYRPRNAVRDIAKALGFSPGQQDAWSKNVEAYGPLPTAETGVPLPVLDLAGELLKAPRHLGIHSGGMVLTDRPVGEVVPIEKARMEKRTVLQWDKDDCAYMGLVKFDLLGLGMLSALNHCFELIAEHTGERWTLETIPGEEPAVYDMLAIADSIGVFQVESRAQMGTLPRLQPRRFYDLVIEIALIRPGPIQGGAVHPYIRRKLGKEPIDYVHPKLKPVLEKTCGVPIFQEQLMQMAVAIGNCDAEDADLLRRSMGSKRGREKIDGLKAKLYAGMAENGLDEETSNAIYDKIQAFADFGFAESHSLSFGLLVYASSWLKLHYPAAFLAALLRSQPMGFYSSQTLTADARRHGVRTLRPDVQRSGWQPGLERIEPGEGPTGLSGCAERAQPPVPPVFDRASVAALPSHRRDARHAVRLGLAGVTGMSEHSAKRIVDAREQDGPFRDLHDLSRRARLTSAQIEGLAGAGALEGLGVGVREGLWEAGRAARERPEQLPHTAVAVQPPLLPVPTGAEQTAFDLWATGITPEGHPMQHLRAGLRRRGALDVAALSTAESGRRIEVGGVVTHRQRPATAGGMTFMNIEDETGLLNVICSVGVWGRYRTIARGSPALIVRGILERTPEGVINLVADRFETLDVGVRTRSRDFQ